MREREGAAAAGFGGEQSGHGLPALRLLVVWFDSSLSWWPREGGREEAYKK